MSVTIGIVNDNPLVQFKHKLEIRIQPKKTNHRQTALNEHVYTQD